MKITAWDPALHGPLSEAAVRARFKEPLHRVFRRDVPEPARLAGLAEARVLVPLAGCFVLVADGVRQAVEPGQVVEVRTGPFTFTSETPVSYLAVYRVPADQWPN